MLRKVCAIILTVILVAWLVRPYVNEKRGKLIYTMVNDITSILGPKCYADFGTLLGAYRDGGVIKDDTDGDLAILKDDEDESFQKLVQGLNSKKYSIVRDPLKIKVWIRNTNLGCDVGIYTPNANNLTRQTFVIPQSKVFPLKTIPWGPNKVSINIPNDPKWYLEYEYGSTWNIPRTGDKGKEALDKGQQSYNKVYGELYKVVTSIAGIPLLLV